MPGLRDQSGSLAYVPGLRDRGGSFAYVPYSSFPVIHKVNNVGIFVQLLM